MESSSSWGTPMAAMTSPLWIRSLTSSIKVMTWSWEIASRGYSTDRDAVATPPGGESDANRNWADLLWSPGLWSPGQRFSLRTAVLSGERIRQDGTPVDRHGVCQRMVIQSTLRGLKVSASSEFGGIR